MGWNERRGMERFFRTTSICAVSLDPPPLESQVMWKKFLLVAPPRGEERVFLKKEEK